MSVIASLAATDAALVSTQFWACNDILASLQPVGVIVGLAETLAKDALFLQDTNWLWLGNDKAWSASGERVLEVGRQNLVSGKSVDAVLCVVFGVSAKNRAKTRAGTVRRRIGLLKVRLLLLAFAPSKVDQRSSRVGRLAGDSKRIKRNRFI